MSGEARVTAELPLLIADVYEAAGALRAHGQHLAAPAGQSQARWQVLSAVSEGDWTVAQAARRLGVTRQAVQRLVNDLEADGLVCSQPNPRHARSPLVRLTEPGRRALGQITQAAAGWHRVAAEELSLTDLLTTRTVLRHLIAASAPAAVKQSRRR
jgi:DNA-binding MarR family transcriptional regulator